MKKSVIKIIISAAFILCFCSSVWSSGIFSTGIGFGISGDTGGNDNTVDYINSEMRKYQILNPGTEVTEIESLYSPVFALNFSYIYNYAIFKAGWEYSTNFFLAKEGSVGNNDIEIYYERFTLPVSAGIVIPFDRKSRFYFAGGLDYSYASLRIKQSNPDPAWILPDKKYTFAGDLVGFHVKGGAEVSISGNYSMVFEFTRYFGTENSVKSEEENGEFSLRLNTFQFTAGINYAVDI